MGRMLSSKSVFGINLVMQSAETKAAYLGKML